MRRHGGAHALLVVLAVGLGGCPKPPPPVAPPPEPQPITVAIIEFGDHGQEAESGCVIAVLDAGLRVVGKKQLDAVLPTDDDIDYQRLGHALGADIIIDGGLPRGVKLKKVPPPRIVSTRAGQILAEAKVQGRLDKGFAVGKKACAELLMQLP